MRKRVMTIGAAVMLGTALIAGGSHPVRAAGRTTSAVHAVRVDGRAAVETALKYLGTPYVSQGTRPETGFDDVGFVTWVYQQQGVILPHGLKQLRATARHIKAVGFQPGYLIFFKNTVRAGLSHVAISIGGGKFIHAEWYGRGVVISSFTNDPVDGNYWADRYMGSPKPVGVPSGVRPPAAGASITVLVAWLNLRRSPSFSSRVVGILPQGAHLTVIASQRAWVEVTTADGTAGWVSARFIGPAASPQQARMHAVKEPALIE